ncbi:hypothetical protein [Acidimangrovimonas pyrenivorans]|uniref:Uncharacterized protein n=1 Tax=Acidimangrovimonas pyrenivorans TaxID=2030798 RepID=A0ABV7AC54_9RHOB
MIKRTEKANHYLSPDEFAKREKLDPGEFLALLSGGLHHLPEVLSIAGELRILGDDWARPADFGLSALPGDSGGRPFMTAEEFCGAYGLSNSAILRLALRYALPVVFTSERCEGGYVLDLPTVRLWALARRAEAAEG